MMRERFCCICGEKMLPGMPSMQGSVDVSLPYKLVAFVHSDCYFNEARAGLEQLEQRVNAEMLGLAAKAN